FEVTLEGNCQSVVNPLLEVSKYHPSSVFTEQYGNFDDPAAIDLYQKMLHETDPARQRALMRTFERHTLDDQVHNITTLWWYRIVAAPLLCEGLEDQSEPFPQSGSRNRVVGQVAQD